LFEKITMPREKYWIGTIGEKDDFNCPILNEFVDGKTRHGPWAIMAPASYKIYGMGLGLGRGQRYKKQENGKWLKVEG
jgi:hypothetical protein